MTRKILMLTAVVLAASCGSAMAAKITFDGFCDGMNIKSNGTQYTSTETGRCLHGVLVMGIGYRTGGKRHGGSVVLAVNWESFDSAPAGSEQYAYILQFPFVTGGTWQEILTKDGSTLTILNTGTYTVSGHGAAGPKGSKPSFIPTR